MGQDLGDVALEFRVAQVADLMGMRSPCIRIMGGTPTARCRSEQPCATASLRNASILAMTAKATRKRLFFERWAGDGA